MIKNQETFKVSKLQKPVILNSLAFGIMSFILPIYSKRLNMSAVEIGGLFSAFSFIVLFLRPIIGIIVDKKGRKLVLVSSLLCYTLSFYIFSIAANIYILYLGRVIQAIASALIGISTYNIIMDLSINDKGEQLGKLREYSTRGSIYGIIIGFMLLSNMPLVKGWEILFKIYAIASIVAAIITIRDIPETKVHKATEKMKDERISVNMIKLFIIIFITATSVSMISPILIIYLQDKFTNDIGKLALAFLPTVIIEANLASKLGKISDKYGRVIPMVVGIIISGIISMLIPQVATLISLAVILGIDSIGSLLTMPAEGALFTDFNGDNERGKMYGVYTAIISLGGVIGPILGGYLYEKISYSAPFYINGIILIFSGMLAFGFFYNMAEGCKEIYKY